MSYNKLFGATTRGGTSGNGTIYELSFLPPELSIALGANQIVNGLGDYVILSWPTGEPGFSFAGFTLQSTTNLTPPVVWSPVLSTPTIVNGQYTVYVTKSTVDQYFRLQLTNP